jgi:hypothetical protein
MTDQPNYAAVAAAHKAWDVFNQERLALPMGSRDDLWSIDENSFVRGYLAAAAHTDAAHAETKRVMRALAGANETLRLRVLELEAALAALHKEADDLARLEDKKHRLLTEVLEERDTLKAALAQADTHCKQWIKTANDAVDRAIQAERDRDIAGGFVYQLQVALDTARGALAKKEAELAQMTLDWVGETNDLRRRVRELEGEAEHTRRLVALAAVEFFSHEIDGLGTLEMTEMMDKILARAALAPPESAPRAPETPPPDETRPQRRDPEQE